MTPIKVESSQPQVEAQTNWQAFILLIVSLVILSFTAIFVKLSVQEISAMATLFNRLWIATIFLGLWHLLSQNHDRIASLKENRIPKDLVADMPRSEISSTLKKDELRLIVILLLAVAIVHVIGRFLWTWSLTQTRTANVSILGNLTSLFTTLGGWLFLGQRFDRRFLIGMAIALSGVITLGLGDMLATNKRIFSETAIIGDGAAFLSSILSSASFLIFEQLSAKTPIKNIMIWRCLISIVLITPLVFAFEDPIFPVSARGWFAVFALAAISEVLGHGLIIYSLKHFSSAFVTTFFLLGTVLTTCLAWVLFSETINSIDFIGFILILPGVYLAKTSKSAEKDNNELSEVSDLESIVEKVNELIGEDLDS